MNVVSDNGIVHKTWMRGVKTAVLACRRTNVVLVGERWFGSWQETSAEVNCPNCKNVNIAQVDVAADATEFIEFAVKRTKGVTLIPVKNERVGQKLLLSKPKGWGTLVYRYVTEWIEPNNNE